MPDHQQLDHLRIRYGLWIILAGFVLVALVSVVSIFKWEDVTSVATAIGATTSLVGTVVGSFLGVQVGAAGKERAQADLRHVEEVARLALSMLPPEVARQIRDETGG
jgi:membrane associated rhomboid family serine protease